MASLRDRSESWRVRGDGWDALAPGLAATWDAARAALRAARRGGSDDEWHEWRKRTKDHWYQARLLRSVWPEMMDPHVAAADHLGEVLGEAGDLAVLREALERADLARDLRDEALDLAAAARAGRLAEAMPLGRRLFAGPARGIVRRWGAWWDLSRPE
jgi:CHAD domain-containing protein